MKNILVIPNIPSEKTTRSSDYEIAKVLSESNKVYYLRWEIGAPLSPAARLRATLKDLFKQPDTYKENSLHILELPNFHRPFRFGRTFNRNILAEWAEKLEIDFIVSSSFLQFPVAKAAAKYIFHFLDLYSDAESPVMNRLIENHLREEIGKADAVTACSRGLVESIKSRYKRDAVFIPNGAHVKDFENGNSKERTDILKKRYGVSNRFIFGCVGNMGKWMNLRFLINSFRKLKKQMPDAAMVLIGPVIDPDFARADLSKEDIIFTGFVPYGELVDHFRLLDVGLMPNKVSEFQHKAFHLKIIEYAAAGKIIVSMPLEEIKLLGFPNIIFAGETEDDWAAKLALSRKLPWKEEWNGLAAPYDWKNIGKQFENLMKKL